MAETEADVVHTVFDWYTRTGMSNGEIASEHNKRQRRVKEAEKADPLRLREQSLYREQARMQNKVDRLLTAYQEELIGGCFDFRVSVCSWILEGNRWNWIKS
jgi:hypothetical protein